MSQTATITRPPTVHTLSGKGTTPDASGTDGIELDRLSSGNSDEKRDVSCFDSSGRSDHKVATARDGSMEESGVPSPTGPPGGRIAHGEVERWNYPRGNVLRLAFAFLTFIIAGMNDAAVGALIPYLEEYYDLNYTTVSLIFLTPFAGYSLAAITNARIHVALGQRGVGVMAPLCHIVTYTVIAAAPPFPVVVAVSAISGFGNGLADACYCAWVGAMDKANQIQGFMHACYSLGALFAPLIATSMVVSAALPWYTYYYLMIGLSAVEWVGLTVTFWRKTGAVYRAGHPRDADAKGAGTKDAVKSKATWLCSLFFFTYMGVEVGLGGWVVTFMLRVRDASAYASGISGSGFWAGMAVGRAALGFVTERFGERLCISIYLACCLALQLLFWLVPQFVVSAVAVAFLGFFLGPMFPGAVMVTAKLLPKDVHVSAIGFAMAIGGTGGTVFPFIIGAIAAGRGVWVLQPIILALIGVVAVVWFLFPRIKKRDEETVDGATQTETLSS